MVEEAAKILPSKRLLKSLKDKDTSIIIMDFKDIEGNI